MSDEDGESEFESAESADEGDDGQKRHSEFRTTMASSALAASAIVESNHAVVAPVADDISSPVTSSDRTSAEIERNLPNDSQSTAVAVDGTLKKHPSGQALPPTDDISASVGNVPSEDKRCQETVVDDGGGDKGSSWTWGSWGASVLSTATSSVAVLTSQFEQGLNTVLETVESSLGAPPPEELATRHAEETTEGGVTRNEDDTAGISTEEVAADTNRAEGASLTDYDRPTDRNIIGSIMSGVSSLGNTLESKVISGGLDTLELIGRKTMDILQDEDPGLKKKRAFFTGGKVSLSEVLREAKEKAAQPSSETNENSPSKISVRFGTVFDDNQGLVHLEALEMLSEQIERKVQVALLELTGDELIEAQSKMKHIEDGSLLKNTDDDENDDDQSTADVGCFGEKLTNHLKQLDVPANVDTLIKVQADADTWLRSCENEQEKREAESARTFEDIYGNAITFLAEFTAKTIELLHKISELVLVAEAHDNLLIPTELVNACCTEISMKASRYSACLNTAADDSEDPDSVSPLITNVYLEASNSHTFVQDAFRLVVPIFQLKYIETERTSAVRR